MTSDSVGDRKYNINVDDYNCLPGTAGTNSNADTLTISVGTLPLSPLVVKVVAIAIIFIAVLYLNGSV